METGPIFAICPVNLKGHRAFSWFQHRPLVHVRNSLIVISSNEVDIATSVVPSRIFRIELDLLIEVRDGAGNFDAADYQKAASSMHLWLLGQAEFLGHTPRCGEH